MKKILVVEDEIAISMVLKAYLEREGFDVVQVYDGLKAIPVFEETKPDLVLLDVMLPDGDGFDILWKLRRHRKYQDLPVVMLTARADAEDIGKGLRLGADGYVTKPYSKNLLAGVIEKVLKHVQS